MSKVTIAKEYSIVSCGMGVQTAAQYRESCTDFPGQQQSGPQKSKSSSSVMQQGGRLIAKKMFRSRSKSQTRPSAHVTCSWTPQGSCIWTNVTGKQVILSDTTLLQLSEVERKILQKIAVAKLHALNLGVNVKVPADCPSGAPSAKPKRRPYLLKRKALTTGIFDAARKDADTGKDKDSSMGGGLVFGLPLAQCVENERARGTSAQVRSPDDASGMNRVSSGSSFASLVEQSGGLDEKGSCESLISSPRERIGSDSTLGLLDSFSSCGSTADLATVAPPAVPNIVTSCIRYLERHGMHTLGIFRVSTSKKRLRQLREDFDCGKDTFATHEQTPHDVATLLKEYLRDLPDPLLCRDLYQAFVQTQRIRNRKLQHEALQHLIQLLPCANRDTLWTLVDFLGGVARLSLDQRDSATGHTSPGNKMDAANLATVFAPNILHCAKLGAPAAAKEAEDRLDIINVTRALIDNSATLFRVSAELMDEVYVHMMDLHPEALDQLLNKCDGLSEDLDCEQVGTFCGDVATLRPVAGRTYSRGEFLHEAAAMGGPNIGMRIRNKDRIRDKTTTKKRHEQSSNRKQQQQQQQQQQEDDSNATSHITSRLRSNNRTDDDTCSIKVRSSSLDSNTSQTDSLPDQSRIYPNDLRVITASLTIPVQQQQLQIMTGHTLSPPDSEDIPFIEEAIEPSKQHITIGLVKTAPTAPPRRQLMQRQQRSLSGESDSSASVTSYMTVGSIVVQQQLQQQHGNIFGGYDSAVGSSATYSSAAQYGTRTPSSIESGSSVQDGGVYSSPPSWASTPPTSPDSHGRAVNYIPEDYGNNKQSATIKKPIADQSAHLARKTNPPHHNTAPPSPSNKQQTTPEYTAAITSIGNAVLRSRTADFERISTKTTAPTPIAANKKYTKRRYTDARHQTTHIPDAHALDNAQAQIYKRNELISSVFSTK